MILEKGTLTQAGRGGAGRRVTMILCLTLVLASVAFFLLPSGEAGPRYLVAINGNLHSVPPSSTLDSFASEILASARPGSSVDVTGDILAIAGGRAPQTEVDNRPARTGDGLRPGASITVAHGDMVLEAVTKRAEEVPSRSIVRGEGPIVRLAEAGRPGEQIVYLGSVSRREAAVFAVTEPRDEVMQRTNTAEAGQKLAALTFDDGPDRWTQGVVDALAARNVPATFFVIGSSAAANKAMIQRLRDAGHQVENHTWSHPRLDRLSAEAIRREIARTQAVIGQGRFLRPPYGAYNSTVAQVASSMGYRLALWTVDTLDWKYPDADAILARVKYQTRPGAIILMHDGGGDRSQTVAAVPRVVDWLLQNGYSLTTLDHLP